METPEFHRLGRRACTRRDMEKTRSSPDSGGSFQRRGNPEFPRAGDSVKSPSFQRAVKHGNPRFPSGAGHGNPKFPGLGRGPPPCAAKWNPGLARDAEWKPQFPQRVSLGGAGGTRKPQVPQAWDGFTPCREMEAHPPCSPDLGGGAFCHSATWKFGVSMPPATSFADWRSIPLAAVAWKPQIPLARARNALLRCEQKKGCLNWRTRGAKGATAIVVRILNKVTRAKLRIEATKG